MMTLVLTPNFKRAVSRAVQTETMRRLAISAIALNRYEHKFGQFPPSLDALVPEFLTAVPRDCMSGLPLHYRLNKDGIFTLYSVGDDGKDDGGDPTPNNKHALWEGRDAVWPTAER